jgi:tetratricopeptide (TPR) repeat protein
MLDKARDLLIEILRANPDGKWAQEQLAALDEETGDAVSTVSPLDEETPTEESAGLSMPDWMQANHLPAAAAEPGGKVRPFVKPFTPEAKSSTSVRDSGSFSTPRSVQAPPATLKPRDTWGPRSLDFASASAESSSSPTSVDKPDLGPLAPESLREALSDEEIIEAVDSFFGVGGSSSTKLDDSSAPRVGSYESWFAEGQAKYEIGMNQEAIDCFLNALAFVNRFCQSERYMQCCVSLGSCYLQRGEGQEAIEWFKRVLQSKDLDMERILAIRYEIARGWELMGNFLQARQELEWIAQSSPNYRDVEQKIKKMNEASR